MGIYVTVNPDRYILRSRSSVKPSATLGDFREVKKGVHVLSLTLCIQQIQLALAALLIRGVSLGRMASCPQRSGHCLESPEHNSPRGYALTFELWLWPSTSVVINYFLIKDTLARHCGVWSYLSTASQIKWTLANYLTFIGHAMGCISIRSTPYPCRLLSLV